MNWLFFNRLHFLVFKKKNNNKLQSFQNYIFPPKKRSLLVRILSAKYHYIVCFIRYFVYITRKKNKYPHYIFTNRGNENPSLPKRLYK